MINVPLLSLLTFPRIIGQNLSISSVNRGVTTQNCVSLSLSSFSLEISESGLTNPFETGQLENQPSHKADLFEIPVLENLLRYETAWGSWR